MRPVVEQHKADQLGLAMLFQEIADGLQRDDGGQLDRVTVDPRADRGKSDTAAVVFQRQFQTAAVSARKQFGFAAPATGPNRSDRVDDVLGGQFAGARNDGRTCRATVRIQTLRFLHDAGTGPAMNRPVDSASTRQTAVGRIDDRVHLLLDDIPFDQFHRLSANRSFHRCLLALPQVKCIESVEVAQILRRDFRGRQSRWAQNSVATYSGIIAALAVMEKRSMRHLGILVLIWIAVSSGAKARDIYVDNVAGDDRFTGAAPATQGARIGPCRTIAQALKLAAPGDRIVLAATGVPYRESITLQAARHSGIGQRPFEIAGGGATLYGAAPVPRRAWEHVGREIYRFSPPRKSFQLLFLDGRPAEEVPVMRGEIHLPELEPRQWCLFRGDMYFRTEPGQIPDSYDLEYCALQVGITMYQVRDVVIRDLIVQGFQLDGINAHDAVFGAWLHRMTCRGNARSGISLGGASRVTVSECLLGGNGAAQLRTEGYSRTRVISSQLLEDTAPALRNEGGTVQFDDLPNAWGNPRRADVVVARALRSDAGD